VSYQSVKRKVIRKCWEFWAEYGPSLTKCISFDVLVEEVDEDKQLIGRIMDALCDDGTLDLRGMGKPVEYRLLRRPKGKIPASLHGNYVRVLHILSNYIRTVFEDSGFGSRLDPLELAKKLNCNEHLTLWACGELEEEECLRDTGLRPVLYEVLKEPPYFPRGEKGLENRQERDEDV